jgi:oligopeptide transport system substrate-binding protein
MNVTKKPWDDVRVRRAIDYAIDRAALCRYVYRIGEEPATALVCRGVPGSTPPSESRDALEKARALLAAAGFPGGKGFPEFELLHAADEAARPVAEAIAARLQTALGISARPVPQEFKVFIDSQKNLRYDVCLGNWIGDYPDPTTFLDVFRAGSGNNRTGWRDAEYDSRLDRAASELDDAKRAALLRNAEDYLLEQGPIAPIAWRGQANLVASDIEGFSANVLDLHPLDLLKRRRP